MSNKVSRHYRIREDILAEVAGMVICVNRDLEEGAKPWTETYLVELALVFFLNQKKKQMAGKATLKAKCLDLSKSEV